MKRTLLLTGFEPFGGDDFKCSGSLARLLHGAVLPGGVSIRSLILPVCGPAAWQKLARSLRVHKPQWIIATGVSGRAELSLESTAWNEDDYRIPDNAGRQPRGTRILSRGPAKLESALNLDPLPGHFAGSALPVRTSSDPGRYVCNHLYYRLLHLTDRPGHSSHRRTLFLHLPATPEMRRSPEDQRFFYPLDDLQLMVLKVMTLLTDGFSPQLADGSSPDCVQKRARAIQVPRLF